MNYAFDNDMFKDNLSRFISKLFSIDSFTGKPVCKWLYEREWTLLNHNLNRDYDYNMLLQNDSIVKFQAEFDSFDLIFSIHESDQKFNLEVKFNEENSVYQLPYVLEEEFQVKLQRLYIKICNQVAHKMESLGNHMDGLNS